MLNPLKAVKPREKGKGIVKYFNSDGSLKGKVAFGEDSYGEKIITSEDEARELVEAGKVTATSDAARIYYARKYVTTTEGNYGIEEIYCRAWGLEWEI